MLAGLIISIAVAAVAVVSLAVMLRERVAWRWLERRHAVVVLHSQMTFDGVLVARRGPLLCMRNATVYTGEKSQGVEVDGEVVIERSQVAWMQVTS